MIRWWVDFHVGVVIDLLFDRRLACMGLCFWCNEIAGGVCL